MGVTGSCLCGEIQYELAERAVWSHSCHCSRCRKTSGGAFAPSLFFPLSAFRYTRGSDSIRSFKPQDAERFEHFFCTHCGSSLPFPDEARDIVGVPMGTLDTDPQFSPKMHIYVASKAPWYSITDELPQFPEGRRKDLEV